MTVYMRNAAPVYSSEEKPLTSESALNLIGDKLATANEELNQVDAESQEGEGIFDEGESENAIEDKISLSVWKNRETPYDFSHMIVLTDKTHDKHVKQAKYSLVLYHHSLDHRSSAFLRTYIEVSKRLAESDPIVELALIHCQDWTFVCQRQQVYSYPTIRIYRNGQFTVYRGLLGESSLLRTIHLHANPAPIQLKDQKQVDQFSLGNVPENIHKLTSVSVLGAFDENSNELKSFKKAAEILHGKLLIGFVTGKEAKQTMKNLALTFPGIVIFKRSDPYEPSVSVGGKFDKVEDLVTTISLMSMPTLPEMTVESLPSLFAHGQPFLLLFGNNLPVKEGVHKNCAELARQNKRVVVAHVNVVDRTDNSSESQLLRFYNAEAELPAIFLINHKENNIYQYTDDVNSLESLSKWLSSAVNGKEKVLKTLLEKTWEPVNSGIDFLKKIDERPEPTGQNAPTPEEDEDEEGSGGTSGRLNRKKNPQVYQDQRQALYETASMLKQSTGDPVINPADTPTGHSEHQEL